MLSSAMITNTIHQQSQPTTLFYVDVLINYHTIVSYTHLHLAYYNNIHKMLALTLIILSLPKLCLPFSVSRNHAEHTQTSMRSASINNADLEVSPQNEEPNQNQVQLWLDLRRSSIAPQAALLHLTNDLWEEFVPPNNKSFIVDKVIINMCANLNSIVRDIREEFETEIGILVADRDGIFEIDDAGIMSSTGTGTIIDLDRDDKGVITLNVNPLPVLDAVSKGQWVLLDVDKQQSGDVSNLVDLVSNGLAFGASGGASNDALVSSGGIGVTCSSQSDVMEMGALVQSLSGTKGYTRTKSGILVQNGDTAAGVATSASIGYAIVMPFDAQLWTTSSFILGITENEQS